MNPLTLTTVFFFSSVKVWSSIFFLFITIFVRLTFPIKYQFYNNLHCTTNCNVLQLSFYGLKLKWDNVFIKYYWCFVVVLFKNYPLLLECLRIKPWHNAWIARMLLAPKTSSVVKGFKYYAMVHRVSFLQPEF